MVDGCLGLGGDEEECLGVGAEDAEPVLQVGGVVGARVVGDAEAGRDG